jgi:beta-phosphoglucomutase
MLAAVVFDFDGVIADSEPLHLRAYQDVLGTAGLDLTTEDYFDKYLGFDDVGVVRTLAADQGISLSENQLADLIAQKTLRFASLVEETDVLFPGAAECVRRLARVVPIAIASGALLHEIDAILRQAGLRDLFPIIVAAGDTPHGKPAPDPYLRALDLLDIPRSVDTWTGAVAIEDSRWGIESARAAGLKCVAVTQTYSAAQLPGADLVVPDLASLTVDHLHGLARH